MAITQVSRDSFARLDVVREAVTVGIAGPTCAWCGSGGKHLAPNAKNGVDDPRRLWRYGIWEDGGRRSWQAELFCCISCMRAYHGA